jgi:hypothetical protein
VPFYSKNVGPIEPQSITCKLLAKKKIKGRNSFRPGEMVGHWRIFRSFLAGVPEAADFRFQRLPSSRLELSDS